MDFIATQKFVLMSPRKVRRVVPMAKKLTPSEALEALPLVEKRAALPLVKVIKTAVANAKQKGIDASQLVFKEIQIGEGPVLKRWRAGARGRAKPYKRRMSHIRVVLVTEDKPEAVKKAKVKASSGKSKMKDKKEETQLKSLQKKGKKK